MPPQGATQGCTRPRSAKCTPTAKPPIAVLRWRYRRRRTVRFIGL